MDATVGIARRTEMSPRLHLAAEVAGRTVLACSGNVIRDLRTLPFEMVLNELSCAACKKYWKSVIKGDRPAE